MKIICFHLFNDFSGSPKVLHEVLTGMRERNIEIELITSRGGVLDDLSDKGVKCRNYSYSFSTNPLVTLLKYSWIQILTFFMALKYIGHKDVVFYINTILPSGPALAGKLMGKKVIYHYHENAFIKSRFYKTLAAIMEYLADKIICVSQYQASFLSSAHKVKVIPNPLNPEFTAKLHPSPEEAFERKTVLMLSSLKEYKGTAEFISLASVMSRYHFVLVINDTQEAIDRWLKNKKLSIPNNLTIHPRTADVSKFYNDASIVLNLSNPTLFIETFGLTAVEAMSCALPVIVPTKGGIAEMVEDGVNGYKIDCSETDRIKNTIQTILSDRQLYLNLSSEAHKFSKKLNRKEIYDSIRSILID